MQFFFFFRSFVFPITIKTTRYDAETIETNWELILNVSIYLLHIERSPSIAIALELYILRMNEHFWVPRGEKTNLKEKKNRNEKKKKTETLKYFLGLDWYV